jgi:hypothetical protein
MSKKTLSKLSAMVLSLGLVTGCATSSQLKQLEADIAKAQQTAADALVAANDAKAAAGTADTRATAAMDAATAAQNAADDCSERCDRMMQKAMSK